MVQPCYKNLLLVLCLLGVPTALHAGTLQHPTVTFSQELHFLTPGGEGVLLLPGTYEVEATDTGLKLLPEGGPKTDAILLEAIIGDHDEQVEHPTARYESAQGEEDVIHLALLLPDGIGLEAVGTVSGIRPRGSALAFLRSKMPTLRQPSLSTSKSKGLTFALPPKPVNCGPFVNDLNWKYHTNPALGVFKSKLHLVTRFSGPNFGFVKNPKNNTLWHSIYTNGTWSNPTQIKGQSSQTRVALREFGNRLHIVYLGASSKQLYHSTYDGEKWTSSTKIPTQSSKNTPVLLPFNGNLYMVYWDHKSERLVYSSYTDITNWKFPRELRGVKSNSGVLIKIPPALFVDKDELYIALGQSYQKEIRLRLAAGKPTTFGDYTPHGIIFGTSERFTGFEKMKAISAISVNEEKGPKEFIMMLNENNKLFYTNLGLIRAWGGSGWVMSFLNERSNTTPALANFNQCLHTVFVEKSSRKLRHLKFDEDRLR